MKQYPTIPKIPEKGPTKFWVFDKLDGSNIRAEWSKKRGFCKFGTRKRLLGTDQGLLALAQSIIESKETHFREIFKPAKIERTVCFFEFWGERSFAGNHFAGDTFRTTLIDVSVYKKGMMTPDKFLKLFDDSPVDSAPLLHVGPITEDLKKQVREGTFPGMTDEGVVCKAKPSKRFNKPIMFKLKSQSWIDRVKTNFDKSRWDDLL